MRTPFRLAALAALFAAPSSSQPCRDRCLAPFNSSSIWNVAIGSNAVYVDAGIYSEADPLRALPVEIHNDQRVRTTSDRQSPSSHP
jgi:hypothetical protein